MSSSSYPRLTLAALALSSLCFIGSAPADERQKKPDVPTFDRLTDADFPTIFDAVQPPKVEPWKSIPWHISIVEAAQQAEREGKPVFLWQADGWPLGCG
jgi:hypothetical protein